MAQQNQFNTFPNMLTPRTSAAGVCIDNDRLLVIGGGDNNNQLDTMELFNMNNMQWTKLPNKMSYRRSVCSAAFVDGKLYIVAAYDDEEGGKKWRYGTHPRSSLKKALMLDMIYTLQHWCCQQNTYKSIIL